jgi:hypothetical protein
MVEKLVIYEQSMFNWSGISISISIPADFSIKIKGGLGGYLEIQVFLGIAKPNTYQTKVSTHIMLRNYLSC